MSPAKTPSASSGSEAIRLIADAGDPMVEIFVIDPDLRRIARAAGRLTVDLPPGIYKVKFKAGTLGGTVEDEKMVVLEPGRIPPVVQPSESISIASPVPIRKTRTSHEYHRIPARAISKLTHARLGSGSRLLIFVRDLDKGRTDNPLHGLTLHTLESDAPIVELEKTGEIIRDFSSGYREGEDEISAACSLELAPGCYRLRVSESPWGSFESAVVTSPGWQTQVFLPRRSFESDPGKQGAFPDLQQASILMARPEDGFDFENPILKLIEKARYALAERRAALGKSAVDVMLGEKFRNPMLGLYAAHILLLAPDPDEGLLNVVITNLRPLLGEHPDLRALELWQAQRAGEDLKPFSFEAIPMLKRSWHIVRSAAAVSEDMVPESSFLSRIPGWEMCDTMWLTWDADAVARLSAEKSLGFPTTALGISGVHTLAADESMRDVLEEANLDPVEREIMAFVQRELHLASGTGDRTVSREERDVISPRNIAVDYVRHGWWQMGSQGSAFSGVRDGIASILSRDDLLRKMGLPKSSVRIGVQRLLQILPRQQVGLVLEDNLPMLGANKPLER